MDLLINFSKIVLLILLVIGYFSIKYYNKFLPKIEYCKGLKSNALAEIQRKANTFEKFAEMVMSAGNYERALIIDVANIRMNKGISVDQKISTVTQILSTSESNPNAMTVELFRNYQNEISNTETRIQVAISEFNNAASDLNSEIGIFPINLICLPIKIRPLAYLTSSI